MSSVTKVLLFLRVLTIFLLADKHHLLRAYKEWF